jgi:putative ABC transport system permease protein
MKVDPGFDPRNTLTLRLSLVGEKYPNGVKQAAFYEQLVQQVQALPGVESAALAYPFPFAPPIQNKPFSIPGRPVDLAQELSAQYNVVSPEYFHTLGIRFTQGRGFTERDREDSPFVAVVNETLARRLWPDENPIGKKISVGLGRASEREVVGVIADIKQRQLDSEPRLQINVPYRQQPMRGMYFAVRGKVPAATLLPAVRQRLATLDRDLPLADVALLSDRVGGSIAQHRFTMALLAGFAATALLLAVVGLYGVISYTVAQRSREFGIRMALGARLADVLRLVVGQGMKLVIVGLVGGVLVSLGLTRVISGLLFGVQPTDPLTFVTVALLLAAVGALACYLPARRATKVDPVVALRAE